MTGIPFLDHNISYTFAKFLSVFIKIGLPVFSVLTAGVLFADWKDWHPVSRLSKTGKALLHILLIVMAFFCIIYGADGRYTETEIGDQGDTDYYYFGKAKNDVRFGFGKLFDKDKNIVMIADAKGHEVYEKVRQYRTKGDITYLTFEGNLDNGKKEGFGRSYSLIQGKHCLNYEGEYLHDKCSGEGTYCKYDTQDGRMLTQYSGQFADGKACGYGEYWTFGTEGELTYYYAGGWADARKCGYGTELNFKDGKVSYAYRGTFWDGKRSGKGIREYVSKSNSKVLWTGISEDDEMTEDGAYYKDNGDFWADDSNGTLVKEEDGTAHEDEERIKELKEKWPLPEERLLGKGAGEYLPKGQ